ncbi:MAG: hypothetical protein WCI51_21585 [Lentisphaerota bacterium]
MKSTITMVMIAGIMFFGFEGFAKTHAAAQNQQKKSTLGVAVCAKAGAAGTTGKVCIGTGGITVGSSKGVGFQSGASVTRGWDKSVTKCAGVSAGAGAKVYVNGGLNACLKNGKPVSQANGGVGVGIGPDGSGGAVYVQVSKTTPAAKAVVGAR